ncbi:hypothetical protein C8Q76DRAFT_629056 [Earliella scabrosa]|nr:hypothetical protein C8Q76DRAFT_629056 [Earliella scabrosa]
MISSNTKVVLTDDDEVLVVAAGGPASEDYDAVNREMMDVFEDVQKVYVFNPSAKANRRGDYNSVSIGVSYGGGQQTVKNLSHAKHNVDVVDAILEARVVKRVANFGSGILYAPRMHAHYGRTLDALVQRDARVRRNFVNNNFAAMTLNLGPRTVTYRHTDHLNVSWGWCAITAFGTYDYTQGGHLILWDLGIAFEFPPGATILIPSAVLTHSNVAIAEHERRYSLTQYTAGGLQRWIDCEHKSQRRFEASGGRLTQSAEERWKDGLANWCTWEELLDGLPSRATDAERVGVNGALS